MGAAPTARVDTTPSGLLLNSQDIKSIDLSYDGSTLTVRVQDVVQPELVFTTSFAANVAQVIGGDTAYVGFTGASGSGGFWELEGSPGCWNVPKTTATLWPMPR